MKIPPEPRQAVWVVVSGDSGGRLESCNCQAQHRGGLPTRAAILAAMRQKNPNVLLVDTGGNAPSSDLAGRARADLTYRAMQAMQYDAVLVSQTDLRQGLPSLPSASDEYRTPFVIANLRRTWGEYGIFWQTRRVVERGGIRFGITGVSGATEADLALPFALEDPVASVSREVSAMRKDVDVVVVLCDSPIPEDNEKLAAIAGVDLLIAPPDGIYPPSVRKTKAPILSYDYEGKGLGRMGVERTEGKVAFGEPQTYPISSDGPEVAEIRLMVDEFHGIALTDPKYAETTQGFLLLQDAEKDTHNPYLGYEACIPCHTAEYQQWKTTPHARAYATLIKAGMQDPAFCVVCHVTGFGRPDGFHVKMPGNPLADVQCETCHGPGGNHATKPEKGNIRRCNRKLCEVCHNDGQSPKFKDHFEEYWRKAIHAPPPAS